MFIWEEKMKKILGIVLGLFVVLMGCSKFEVFVVDVVKMDIVVVE